MLQIVSYTVISGANGPVIQGEGKIIGTVPGDPDAQLTAIAEVLFPYVFNPDGSLRSLSDTP